MNDHQVLNLMNEVEKNLISLENKLWLAGDKTKYTEIEYLRRQFQQLLKNIVSFKRMLPFETTTKRKGRKKK